MQTYDARHPAIRNIPWRDLVTVSRAETAAELSLSLPWLAASWYLGGRGWVVPALACSFMFFLTALRQAHNAFHYALGIPRRATEWVIFALSVLMLGSNHAVQYNHLQHHKHCLDDLDLEASSAKQAGWRVLLFGFEYPIRLHAAALRNGRPQMRRWICVELAANIIWIGLVFGLLRTPALQYHVVAMLIGQWLAPFFCVWTVHHGADGPGLFARTERRALLNAVTYNMFLHLEHHLFPAVPTRRLGALARRLDAALGRDGLTSVIPAPPIGRLAPHARVQG